MTRSYRSQVLYVNLSDESSKVESLPEDIFFYLLGGKGLGIYLLAHQPPKIDPFSRENQLIFVTGPLTGTIAPTAGRFGVVTKSPATNGFLDSYCGGFLGPEIKRAGYDAIIFQGKAESPVVVNINNDNIEFLKGDTWISKSPAQCDKMGKEKFGPRARVASIGIAGEKLGNFAGIFSDQRCAGRGGAGAVMGSKNLKAMIIQGTLPVEIYNPEQFRKDAWIARRYIRSSELTVRALPEEGTCNIVDIANISGILPTRNFQTSVFNEADKINGSAWRTNYWKNQIACFGCPIGCSKISYSKRTPTIIIDGPDYETVFALGSNVGNANQDIIIEANALCDEYGIDTISTGNVIGFVMELVQRGLATSSDFDGIPIKWGEPNTILELIKKIGTQEGCGELLAQGVAQITKKFPRSEIFAMHVKGLEIPGYEPRATKGMGLNYAISDRGACHLHSYCVSVEIFSNKGGMDPFLTDDRKVRLVYDCQAESNLIDSMILCMFAFFGMRMKEAFQMLSSATGLFKDEDDEMVLQSIADRIVTMTRLFNLREGWTLEDDTLPPRFLNEPLPSGPAMGQTLGKAELESMKKEYFKLMGWDEKGAPLKKTIEKLKINQF